ncbi:MAG: D-tyrosyl-tRNA(Tyr) deacylase [Solobacterium sp.]|nr:D-tyrosyl-tRNA(Tyr) deacylase [Solobacterium sp.]
MKAVIQRVREASVTVDGNLQGAIGTGFLVLAGFSDEDDETIVRGMADKIRRLRIFEDSQGKMNRSLEEVGGEVLSISQFTLYADCHKGNRPSFSGAGSPAHAEEMYQLFNKCLRENGLKVEEGIFAADMKVRLLNDGPVTIILDSKEVLHGNSHLRK